MNSRRRVGHQTVKLISSEKIQLRFSLALKPPEDLVRLVASTPNLITKKAKTVHFENTYFDTPDRLLRHNQLELLIQKKIVSVNKIQWLQVLQSSNSSATVLHRTNQLSTLLSDGQLNFGFLHIAEMGLFNRKKSKRLEQLQPYLKTSFERTSWSVKAACGSQVSVALECGELIGNMQTAPIRELVLELLQGNPTSLFDVAHEIAQSVPMLLVYASVAERSTQIIEGKILEPVRPKPTSITRQMTVKEVIGSILRESFVQFTSHLDMLRSSQNPELVHQARIGWRRFKSALRLFKKSPCLRDTPSRVGFRPLLKHLTLLRDLDVSTGYVELLQGRVTANSRLRSVQIWKKVQQGLRRKRKYQRSQVLAAFLNPSVGVAIIDIYRWLEFGIVKKTNKVHNKIKLNKATPQVTEAIRKLADQLLTQPINCTDPEIEHRTRILAKQLRYNVEALAPLLPAKKAKIWHKAATRVQVEIGASRDIFRTIEIIAHLGI
jgi:inorganic triphosphatase YgiF